MLRREKDMSVETRERMRGGKGTVFIRHLAEHLPPMCRFYAEITLHPGCSIGEHEHLGETELFVFVSGAGMVTDNGTHMKVKAGDATSTPNGHTHSVANTGTDDLVFIAAIIKDPPAA
ncbi:MAG: cupin domain-containing protein [Clostridia bacterium]|nr:cupin domain-containing protein [Clostridia bacterium]